VAIFLCSHPANVGLKPFDAVLVFLLYTLGSAVFVGIRVHSMRSVSILALRNLRTIFALLISVLAIPVAQILSAGLHCVNGVNLRSQLICSEGLQLHLMFFNAIGLLVFIPFSLVGILVVSCTQFENTVRIKISFVKFSAKVSPTLVC
jgi:hypothetical protein